MSKCIEQTISIAVCRERNARHNGIIEDDNQGWIGSLAGRQESFLSASGRYHRDIQLRRLAGNRDRDQARPETDRFNGFPIYGSKLSNEVAPTDTLFLNASFQNHRRPGAVEFAAFLLRGFVGPVLQPQPNGSEPCHETRFSLAAKSRDERVDKPSVIHIDSDVHVWLNPSQPDGVPMIAGRYILFDRPSSIGDCLTARKISASFHIHTQEFRLNKGRIDHRPYSQRVMHSPAARRFTNRNLIPSDGRSKMRDGSGLRSKLFLRRPA